MQSKLVGSRVCLVVHDCVEGVDWQGFQNQVDHREIHSDQHLSLIFDHGDQLPETTKEIHDLRILDWWGSDWMNHEWVLSLYQRQHLGSWQISWFAFLGLSPRLHEAEHRERYTLGSGCQVYHDWLMVSCIRPSLQKHAHDASTEGYLYKLQWESCTHGWFWWVTCWWSTQRMKARQTSIAGEVRKILD